MRPSAVRPRVARSPLPVLLCSALVLVAVLLSADAGDAGERSTVKRAPLPPTPERFFGASGRKLSHADLRRMAEAGVGTYRTLFHFRLAKRRKNGFYDWSEFDRLVGRTASHGIELLPLLYGTPNWIYRDESTPPIYDARAEEEWRRLLRELVGRYGPHGLFWRLNPLVPKRPVRHWQIWNEPNDAKFWSPAPDPAAYGRLLRISSATIHGADPGATVIAAGVVAEPFSGGIPGPEYLAELASDPAVRAAADRFAYHPYAGGARKMLRHMWRARRALKAVGAGDHRLWVTEIGWGSQPLVDRLLMKTEAGQARALRLSFRKLLRKRVRLRVDRVLWYYWRDHHDPFCLWCRSAGLLDNEYREKPALQPFSRLATR